MQNKVKIVEEEGKIQITVEKKKQNYKRKINNEILQKKDERLAKKQKTNIILEQKKQENKIKMSDETVKERNDRLEKLKINNREKMEKKKSEIIRKKISLSISKKIIDSPICNEKKAIIALSEGIMSTKQRNDIIINDNKIGSTLLNFTENLQKRQIFLEKRRQRNRLIIANEPPEQKQLRLQKNRERAKIKRDKIVFERKKNTKKKKLISYFILFYN